MAFRRFQALRGRIGPLPSTCKTSGENAISVLRKPRCPGGGLNKRIVRRRARRFRPIRSETPRSAVRPRSGPRRSRQADQENGFRRRPRESSRRAICKAAPSQRQHLFGDLAQGTPGDLGLERKARNVGAQLFPVLRAPRLDQLEGRIEGGGIVEQPDKQGRQCGQHRARSSVGAAHLEITLQPDLGKDRREVIGPVGKGRMLARRGRETASEQVAKTRPGDVDIGRRRASGNTSARRARNRHSAQSPFRARRRKAAFRCAPDRCRARPRTAPRESR